MASTKIADRIIVFKQAEIIETGTRDELMILERNIIDYIQCSQISIIQRKMKIIGVETFLHQ